MGVISDEFFPTPYSVVMKMIEPYGYYINKRSVLEPSAGDGAILDAIQQKCRGGKKLLCAIESNYDLQYTLQGKGLIAEVYFPRGMKFRSATGREMQKKMFGE